MTHAEAIAEGRRKLEAGEFHREPVRTEPEDLFWDRIYLECGHRTVGTPKLRTQDGKQQCNACAKEWIKANTDAD